MGRTYPVLILISVEDTLRVLQRYGETKRMNCLNPYSSGRYSPSIGWGDRSSESPHYRASDYEI